MKYTKLILILGALAVVTVGFYYYMYHHRKTNIIRKEAISKVETTTSSLNTKKQIVQIRERLIKEHMQEMTGHGDCNAADEMYQANKLEKYLLTLLQENKWKAVGIINALLFHCKMSPDRFSMRIRNVLVDILDKELAKQKSPYSVGQEGGEMDQLTSDVCVLYNPKAIPLLVKLNMISCLSNYGAEGAGIVLSTSALLATEVATTKLEALKLSGKKGEIISAIGGFTNSPTSWNSLNPNIQNKLKIIIYNDLKNKSWGLRLWAIKALVPIADKDDIGILKEIYYTDPNKGPYSVREEAEKALTERAFLWDSLDKDTQIKIRNNIYNKLRSKDWIARWNAIKELAHIADKNDIPLLEKLFQDPVSYVSEVAKQALEELKAKGITQ